MILQVTSVWLAIEIVSMWIQKKKVDYTLGLGALLITAQVIVDAIGDMGHLYGQFLWYDQMLHFASGFIATFIVGGLFYAIHKIHDKRRPGLEVFIAALGVGTLVSVVYEIEEYLEDFFTGSHRLGDGFDTANGLMLAVLGGIIAAWFVIKWPRTTTKE